MVELVNVEAMCHMDTNAMRIVCCIRAHSKALKDIIFGAIGVVANCWDYTSVEQHLDPGAGRPDFNSAAFL